MRVAVAIPARNEAALIGRCLDALAAQHGAGALHVVVVANGCDDDTAAIARRPRAVPVTVVETTLPPDMRHAGGARRLAMAEAARDADLILTTDADCVADPDWVAGHRRAFAAGVDAVCGRVSGDREGMALFDERARRIGRLEWDYLVLIAEAEARFDPRPHDPLPRHGQCCGANLGITAAMLGRVGGVPAFATGEDRALIAAVERAGGRVRHDPRPHVTASARLDGRAAGGMAAVLRARLAPDYACDAALRPAEELLALWASRARARAAGLPVAGSVEGPPLRPDDLPAEAARLRAAIVAFDAGQARTAA